MFSLSFSPDREYDNFFKLILKKYKVPKGNRIFTSSVIVFVLHPCPVQSYFHFTLPALKMKLMNKRSLFEGNGKGKGIKMQQSGEIAVGSGDLAG